MNDLTHIDFTRVFDIPEYQQRKYPQQKAVVTFQKDEWKGYSMDELRLRIDAFSSWLLNEGYGKGERIVIIPKMGSPEWMIIDFACQQIGLVVVPVHPTSSPSEMEFILREAEARLCIALDRLLYDKVDSIHAKLPALRSLYHLESGLPGALPSTHGAQVHPDLQARKDQVSPTDTLVIMYTSGTSGTPKGAVLTHVNVVSNIKSVLALLPLIPGQRALSFLPFSHIFERTSCYSYMCLGVSIHFSETLDRLRHDFNTVHPFFCTCVPRTLEKMYDILQEQRQQKHFLKQRIIGWAMNIGQKYKDSGNAGMVYRIKLFMARLLVLNYWRSALGGKLKYMAVGAAALRPEIGRLFSAAGIMTLSGYGMTEASPFISVNRYLPGLNRFGTVGIPVPGVEIRLADTNEQGEGEIHVRGPNIMSGYFNRPELNQEVFTPDGWFRTGDVGKMTAKRFLTITDRKKDIFKTTSGKYIAPQPLESRFTSSPFITQCLVIGFNKPYIIAIFVPHFQVLMNWCVEQGIHWTSPQFMVHNIKVVQKFQDEVDAQNEGLQGFEQVRKFILSDEEWTVENKDLTTSFKPMRNKLLEKYKVQIERLYA